MSALARKRLIPAILLTFNFGQRMVQSSNRLFITGGRRCIFFMLFNIVVSRRLTAAGSGHILAHPHRGVDISPCTIPDRRFLLLHHIRKALDFHRMAI